MEKRIFDEKTKRKLSGLLPFQKDAFVVWTPEQFLDVPVEAQPVFHVRPFDAKATAHKDSALASGVFGVEHAREMIKSAFPFWKNLLKLPTLEEEIPFGPDAFGELNETLVWIMYQKASECTYGMTKEEREALG